MLLKDLFYTCECESLIVVGGRECPLGSLKKSCDFDHFFYGVATLKSDFQFVQQGMNPFDGFLYSDPYLLG